MSPRLGALLAVIDSAYQWWYVAAGWGIVIVVLVGYSIHLLRRGRSLSRRVPPEDRRWM